MSDVLFDTGSYTLRPAAREKLAKISGIVLAHPGLILQIEGHTDSVGSDDFNQRLSEQRAGSVLAFLAEQGVSASAMTSRGFGKTAPRRNKHPRRWPPAQPPRRTRRQRRSHRQHHISREITFPHSARTQYLVHY